jgi:uncharacterized protein DUF4340
VEAKIRGQKELIMKPSGLIVAVAVLAALSGTLYWSNHHKPAETMQASADTPPKILTLSEADVSKIDLRKKSGDEVVLAKDNAGKWLITAPKPLPADQSSVSSVLSSLSSLSSDRLVEEKAANLNPYGLEAPVLEADITEKNNKTHKLLIGDDTPTNNGAYVKLEGDPRVFTIASYNKSNIDKGVNDLRDKRLITAESDKISRLELVVKQQDIEFGRNKDQWQIVKPQPLRANGTQVDDLIRKLTDAKMDLASDTDPKKTASAFAAATPLAMARMTTDSGTQELQVRKRKNDYYAKSSIVDGVYKVSSDLGQGLDKKLEDFRNKKLFDFGFNDPTKIEVHDGSKAYFLTKGGDDWWGPDGKKLDSSSAYSLVSNVRDLQASKFVDDQFSTPAITITATSNDGKRTEKVLISQNGGNYVAKRENEPALYALDRKPVEDLQKSAGELKPASTSSK